MSKNLNNLTTSERKLYDSFINAEGLESTRLFFAMLSLMNADQVAKVNLVVDEISQEKKEKFEKWLEEKTQ